MKSKDFKGLNYKRFGKGPTVVFIHGFLESITMWDFLSLEKLPIDCILVDLPGHGKSVLTDEGTPSMEYYTQSLQELIDHLGIEKFSVVGHSMGGYVGAVWIKQNSSIRKMTFLNSHFWEDSEEKKKDRAKVSELVKNAKSLFLKTAIPNLFFKPENHQEEIKAIIEEAENFQNVGIAYASMAMANRSDFTNYVNLNPQKFTMILGSEDWIVPIDQIKKTVNPVVEIDVIVDAGHMAHIDKSEEVLKLLSKHLI